MHTGNMRKNQKGIGFFETLLFFVFIAVLIGVVSYILNYQTKVTFSNNGTNFSFDMGVPAKTKKISSANNDLDYYVVKLSDYSFNVVATAYEPDQNINSDVQCLYLTFKVDILGIPHSVCNQQNKVYTANFNNGDKWYQVVAFAEGNKDEIKRETVIKLFSSLKVEK
jgi:cell division protein FtsL